MSIFVIAEHDGKFLSEATKKTLTAALSLGQEISILIAGHNCQEVVTQAAKCLSVKKVHFADYAHYVNQLPEDMAELIAQTVKGCSYLLAPANTFGKNILPRVAAKLGFDMLSEVSKIIDFETFERPIYAGNAIATYKNTASTKILTIRTTAFTLHNKTQDPCEIIALEEVAASRHAHFIKNEYTKTERPDLSTAKVVVSGGRALKSAENFANILEPLADTLNAAIGATRAAVDAEFVPNDYQVGQTGKAVAPDLYIAIGISGAIQHIAGIKDAKTIVAINKDMNAPIFQIADYGLVGDLFILVPELQQALSKG